MGSALAATAVTVTIAIPMLIASAAWEVHVWPHLLRAASPVADAGRGPDRRTAKVPPDLLRLTKGTR